MNAEGLVIQRFRDSIETKEQIIQDTQLICMIVEVAKEAAAAFRNGKKMVLCGNGGSASDALHFAGEIVGRFQMERPAWSAVVLNADMAVMTAIANDYGYDEVFARSAQGHVKSGDIFVGISTSGNSENVLRAAKVAREQGAVTVALLGKDGGRIRQEVDYPLIVHNNTTARVQEGHICIIHILCELIEDLMENGPEQ